MKPHRIAHRDILPGLKDADGVKSDAHSGVRLQCPCCKAETDRLDCPRCAFRMQICNGIVHALRPSRSQHFSQFIKDYERIRAAEGRGSQSEEYYLELPYQDTTGRNSGQWKIRARSYDFLVRHVLRQGLRQGKILDLGAGNCWMSFRLALAGYQPVAVDLLVNEYDGLAAARPYEQRLSSPLPRFQAELTCLPFQDEQFDIVIFNASFHYSEDYCATLGEALRCLKRGGKVIISDTPWYARDESGRRMVAERKAAFRQRFNTASDSVTSLEYLTDERLRILENKFSIHWTAHSPWYGFKWFMRPWLAKIRQHREPSRFRIYEAIKND